MFFYQVSIFRRIVGKFFNHLFLLRLFIFFGSVPGINPGFIQIKPFQGFFITPSPSGKAG